MTSPSWAPDGKRLVYECYLEGPTEGGECSFTDRLVEPPDFCQAYYRPEAADICVMDIDKGQRIHLTQDPGGDWHPSWSPDGSQIAYKRQDGIYLMDADGQNRRRLVSPYSDIPISRDDEVNLVWAPDGSRLLFSACLDRSNYDIYVINLKDGTLTTLTPNSDKHDIRPGWLSDENKIFFLSTTSSSWGNCLLKQDASHEMKIINTDGSGERSIWDQKFYYPSVSVSPDGQIAFVSDLTSETREDFFNVSGKTPHIYEMDFINPKPTEILEVSRMYDPLGDWSPEGRYLIYGDSFVIKILNLETKEIREVPEVDTATSKVSWSPDGRKIAIIGQNVSKDILHNKMYIFDLKDGTLQQLAQN
jgi:Tol biopolymer transport system component